LRLHHLPLHLIANNSRDIFSKYSII